MAAKKTKPTPKEAWEAILRAAEEDEIDRALAETPEEVDEGLRAYGMDPAKVRADGEAFVKRLMKQREENAWLIEADEGQAREQARLDAMRGRYAAIPRSELLDRL